MSELLDVLGEIIEQSDPARLGETGSRSTANQPDAGLDLRAACAGAKASGPHRPRGDTTLELTPSTYRGAFGFVMTSVSLEGLARKAQAT